jgi:hypothetical protein
MLGIVALLIGLFYALGAAAGARRIVMDSLLDVAIAGVTLKKVDPVARERTLWMLAGLSIVGAGGLLLAIGSALAAFAFLLGCVWQSAHFLVLSPRRYDRADPVEPAGRRRSLNAFAIYAIITALVVWAAASGGLLWPHEAPLWPLGVIAALWIAGTIYFVRSALTLEQRTRGRSFEPDDSADAD